MKRSDVAILAVAISLIAGLGGFGLGRATASKTQTASAASNGAGNGGQSGFGRGSGGGRRFGGRPVFGMVSSLSGNTLSITDSTGGTHAVMLSSSTTYTNGTATASQSDLTAGTKVAAFGQTASDGTITATRVIINPTIPSGGNGGTQSGGSQLN